MLNVPGATLIQGATFIPESRVVRFLNKVCSEKKTDNFCFWSFYNRFWLFFCHLHKYLSQNLDSDSHFEELNMCKSQLDQNLWPKLQIVLKNVFFNFGRKKTENLSFKNGHFFTICGHFYGNYIDIFHKTEFQTVILRCLEFLNIDSIKSYDIISS